MAAPVTISLSNLGVGKHEDANYSTVSLDTIARPDSVHRQHKSEYSGIELTAADLFDKSKRVDLETVDMEDLRQLLQCVFALAAVADLPGPTLTA